jgi:hypothetical protein
MSDMLFDNIFTVMAFHRLIQESAAQVVQNSRILRGEKEKAEQRLRVLKAEAEDASAD